MVDARGYLCPMPVVMVQKALEAEHPDTLEVLVDNETAVENIKRFAAHSGTILLGGGIMEYTGETVTLGQGGFCAMERK